MDIITTLPAQETISQNNCQMRFLDKLALKQVVDNKLMINDINFSTLDSPSTSNDDKVDNGVSKSTV